MFLGLKLHAGAEGDLLHDGVVPGVAEHHRGARRHELGEGHAHGPGRGGDREARLQPTQRPCVVDRPDVPPRHEQAHEDAPVAGVDHVNVEGPEVELHLRVTHAHAQVADGDVAVRRLGGDCGGGGRRRRDRAVDQLDVAAHLGKLQVDLAAVDGELRERHPAVEQRRGRHLSLDRVNVREARPPGAPQVDALYPHPEGAQRKRHRPVPHLQPRRHPYLLRHLHGHAAGQPLRAQHRPHRGEHEQGQRRGDAQPSTAPGAGSCAGLRGHLRDTPGESLAPQRQAVALSYPIRPRGTTGEGTTRAAFAPQPGGRYSVASYVWRNQVTSWPGAGA